MHRVVLSSWKYESFIVVQHNGCHRIKGRSLWCVSERASDRPILALQNAVEPFNGNACCAVNSVEPEVFFSKPLLLEKSNDTLKLQ